MVFMLYGHAVSALLAPRYQTGVWFDVWQFQRGLTSSLFLLLSGFAFSIATSKHWASHLGWSAALVRRIRRFALFVLLGYALHLPVAQFRMLPDLTTAQRHAFLGVDVLQLIGVTFIGVQLLVLVTRTRMRFAVVALGLAGATLLLTPLVWSVDWQARLPLWLAAYFSQATGSLFPLFPWMTFVMLGAALGQLFAGWGAPNLARFANIGLLAPGVALVVLGFAARSSMDAFGQGPGRMVPGEVLTRAGTCLLILGAIAHLSRQLTRLPHVFGAVAQESLLIYFVHLCIVYGSVWNNGLAWLYGPTLTPLQTLAVVILLILSMVGLAWFWNWCKHARPRLARWTMYVVWALLIARLL